VAQGTLQETVVMETAIEEEAVTVLDSRVNEQPLTPSQQISI